MSDLSDTVREILLPECPQCSSRYCGPVRCRFTGMTHEMFEAAGADPVRVRGILFRDEDDAYEHFEQRDLDEKNGNG